MMADLTAAGDHCGNLPRSSAPDPAICGAAMEVPDMNPNFSPLKPIGETADRTATPGAGTSGFSRSPPAARLGPRDENSAICGTGGSAAPVVSSILRFAVIRAVAVTASLRSGLPSWQIRMLCMSISSKPDRMWTSTLHMPPTHYTFPLQYNPRMSPRPHTTPFLAALAEL